MTEEVVTRDAEGKFLAGVSGNPLGRPKGKKNELTELKQDLEIAVRKSLPVSRITKIVEKVAQMAEEGNLRAAKLLLDKVISNAKDVDDVDDKATGGIRIVIENATILAQKQREHSTPKPLDGEFTEVNT